MNPSFDEKEIISINKRMKRIKGRFYTGFASVAIIGACFVGIHNLLNTYSPHVFVSKDGKAGIEIVIPESNQDLIKEKNIIGSENNDTGISNDVHISEANEEITIDAMIDPTAYPTSSFIETPVTVFSAEPNDNHFYETIHDADSGIVLLVGGRQKDVSSYENGYEYIVYARKEILYDGVSLDIRVDEIMPDGFYDPIGLAKDHTLLDDGIQYVIIQNSGEWLVYTVPKEGIGAFYEVSYLSMDDFIVKVCVALSGDDYGGPGCYDIGNAISLEDMADQDFMPYKEYVMEAIEYMHDPFNGEFELVKLFRKDKLYDYDAPDVGESFESFCMQDGICYSVDSELSYAVRNLGYLNFDDFVRKWGFFLSDSYSGTEILISNITVIENGHAISIIGEPFYLHNSSGCKQDGWINYREEREKYLGSSNSPGIPDGYEGFVDGITIRRCN